MEKANIIYFVSILACAMTFLAISVWAFTSKNPVNFWAGEKISADSISDIKKYNQAYGVMWLIFGLCWLITAVLGLFSLSISIVVLVVLNTVGLVTLILVNNKIRKRYMKTTR